MKNKKFTMAEAMATTEGREAREKISQALAIEAERQKALAAEKG